MANLFDIGDLVEIHNSHDEKCTAQIQAVLVNKKTETYFYGFFKETVEEISKGKEPISLGEIEALTQYQLLKEVVFDKREQILWCSEYELTMIKERNQIPVILHQIRKEIGI